MRVCVYGNSGFDKFSQTANISILMNIYFNLGNPNDNVISPYELLTCAA